MPTQPKIIENNLVVPIDQVYPNDYNPKPDYNSTPELQKAFAKIVESLKYHGQGDPLKVRETEAGYEIMDGFHRYNAMKELGFEKVEIKNFGKLSREEAIKVTLTMEETGVDLDPIERAKLLKEFREMEYSIAGLPYSIEEIDTQIQLLDHDWGQYDGEGPKKRTLKTIECPQCHHEFTI